MSTTLASTRLLSAATPLFDHSGALTRHLQQCRAAHGRFFRAAALDIPLSQPYQVALDALLYLIRHMQRVDVEADKWIPPPEHAMLLLNFQIFEWEDGAGLGQFSLRHQQRHDKLFPAPALMRLGVPLHPFPVVVREHQQEVEIGTTRQKLTTHGAAVEQDAFQLGAKQRRRLLDVTFQQLLKLGGNIKRSRLSHIHLCCRCGMMLKTPASCVLASFRSSPYRKGTPRPFTRCGLAG